MRKAIAVCFLFLVLSGCADQIVMLREQPSAPMPTRMTYSATFDSTWSCLLKVMREYPVAVLEKTSGLYETDWVLKESSKKVVTDRGILGQIEEDWPYEYREKLHVVVFPSGEDSTTVDIKRFVELRYSHIKEGPKGTWYYNRLEAFQPAQSTTLVEYSLLQKLDRVLRSPGAE
jgi:hypothetical protein